jgi:hypothetical protein
MGRVITNGMTLSKAREASLGVLPVTPQWFELEPNEITSYGVTTSSTSRSPISRARARRKGSVTDLDSAVEFGADLTLTALRFGVEEFLFSRSAGAPSYITSAATGTGYTVPALSAADAAKFIYSGGGAKTLVYAHGFATAANNGLKTVGAAPAAGATEIAVAGNAAEVPPVNDLVEVSIAGVRSAAGDLDIDAQGNITSAAGILASLGLVVGQVIHVGGRDALNQFTNPANIGFARVAQIAAGKLTLEKRQQAFVVEANAAVAVDLLFGQFVRNVSVDHADFLQPSTQFELSSPGLMTANATGYEYAIGNWADALSISIPLSGKATMTMGYVGTNTTEPATARASQAANAKQGGLVQAFGTASDIARLRVQKVDETGLSTDFKSASFTLTNNVAGEKFIGTLGPKYLSAGNIEVDVENQMLFSNPDVPHAIRCNQSVGFDFALRNGEGGVVFDLPTGTLTGGEREYPTNQSVLMNSTFAAHQEDTLDFTVGVSFFPVLPPQVC